jgi:hypothetical protein
MRPDRYKLHPLTRDLLSEWMLEISALLAVFPLIDQLAAHRAIHWTFVAVGELIALLFLLLGIELKTWTAE